MTLTTRQGESFNVLTGENEALRVHHFRPEKFVMGQLTAYESTGHKRLRAVCPAKHFGLLAFGRLQGAQRTRHGNHMQQGHTKLELGIEHHRAVNMADRTGSCPLEHLHHAAEMHQHPKHQHTDGSRYAGPAVRPISQYGTSNQGKGNENFLKVHGAIFAATKHLIGQRRLEVELKCPVVLNRHGRVVVTAAENQQIVVMNNEPARSGLTINRAA